MKQIWENTDDYVAVVNSIQDEFYKKDKLYGKSWRKFSLTGLTDQIYIKIARLQSLASGKVNLVKDEKIEDTLKAIYNYCIIRQFLSFYHFKDSFDYLDFYDNCCITTYELMYKKNSDYGSVWKEIRISSLYDLMMVKLDRILTMENNNLFEHSSEFQDIANYAVFAILRLNENKTD